MAEYPRDPSPEELRNIFTRSFQSGPKLWSNAQRLKMGDQYEHTPVHDMLTSSAGVDYARQYLPEKVESTAWGKWVADQLPGADPRLGPDSRRRAANEFIRGIRLGGYSPEELKQLDELRATDPEVQRYTVRRGEVPTPDGTGVIKTGDNFRAAAAQAAGVTASDFATDGLRNIWWFLNAPQAVSSIAMLHGMHTAGSPYVAGGKVGGHLMPNRRYRMAATVPAWIGMSTAVGNFGRQPGYKAAVPSEADPRTAVDPLSEMANRYFLGRAGRLLPYDEFVKERPDVSKGEYNAYKAYLFGNPSPIKATMEGIHGPEVTFMGKSIPVATGILPAIAAVVGGRRGIVKAGERLNKSVRYQKSDPLRAGAKPRTVVAEPIKYAEDLKKDWTDLKVKAKDPSSGVGDDAIKRAYNAYRDVQDENERQVFKQVFLGSSKYMGGTALGGMALESMRRAAKGEAPVEV